MIIILNKKVLLFYLNRLKCHLFFIVLGTVLTLRYSLVQSLPINSDQLLTNNPPIQNPQSKIQNPLPCLDTTNPCVEQLTQQAVSLRECGCNATSLTLQTLNERITLIDDRLALMGDRKDYAESKLWTNYFPTATNIDGIIDPFAWIRNLAGGGDMQRDRLAIADLEVKGATLEAARAELERRREQEKVNLGEKVLQLLLGYEGATREVELVESQVRTFQVSREAFRIRYRFL